MKKAIEDAKKIDDEHTKNRKKAADDAKANVSKEAHALV